MLSSDEFRVFDLLPFPHNGDSQDMLRGQTRVIPLPTDARYETLSYVWGIQQEWVTIQVDGKDRGYIDLGGRAQAVGTFRSADDAVD
jgi:hypothetical protein